MKATTIKDCRLNGEDIQAGTDIEISENLFSVWKQKGYAKEYQEEINPVKTVEKPEKPVKKGK